ncbi:hypothetical protein [Chryseobacterium sp. Mn2064]|uniref:hypothetical protein n=1 Tax=Chryseobacterium sp. Mn2064 TaxID=3395263 RepID=UPI003BE14FC7
MSDKKVYISSCKIIVLMVILVFSLSPCSVKRNVLDIFDIQYISGLNKVKITPETFSTCDSFSASSKASLSKAAAIKHKGAFPAIRFISRNIREEKIFFNDYSGHSTGNSPPKYILFKRLKLSLV